MAEEMANKHCESKEKSTHALRACNLRILKYPLANLPGPGHGAPRLFRRL